MQPLRTLIALGCLAFAILCFPPTSSGATTLSLDSAVKKGKVALKVVGLGGSTGDTLLIKLRRTVPEVLRITLASGTVFTSASGSAQNMVAARLKGEQVTALMYRPAPVIVLRDDEEHTYIVEAYCLDFHKDNPGEGEAFLLSTVDTRAKQILDTGLASKAPMSVIQSAIWMDRDHVSAVALKQRFQVNDEQIAQAKALLQKVDTAK